MIIKALFLLFYFTCLNCKPKLTIGTGGFGFGCGSNSPAAQVPHSFVRLGPDTTPFLSKEYLKFQHFGGYNDADRYLRAFSHMHLVGAGDIDMGNFGILPKKADKKPVLPKDDKVIFFKQTEYAEPGYYKLDIESNITVQLTTTQRSGAHRYTFHSKGSHQINVMTGYLLDKQANRKSKTYKCGQKCLQGSILTLGEFGKRFGGYTAYFHLQWFSSIKQKVVLYNDTLIDENANQTIGNSTGAIIITDSSIFELHIGISYVSIQNAKLNLQTEVGKKMFDLIKAQSHSNWEAQFKRFQISAITQDYQTKIDTAIYRTFLTPTIFNDANRQYISFRNNGSISKVPEDMEAVYTDLSIWDIHRTQMPWLLFQDLKRFNDIAKSIILFNREGGYMPKWPFAQGWTNEMTGSHANTILADWIIKQAQRKNLVNIQQVFEYMIRNANTHTPHDSRPVIQFYRQNGYVHYQNYSDTSVIETIQLSFNDYSIGKIAQILNKTQQIKDFKNRSKFYKNVWNNETKFFQPKYKNGSFIKISKKQRINIINKYYYQGNAWHYRFFAPHDPQGLIQLFGGRESFLKELNKFFSRSKFWPINSLPNPYYWAGNQHNLFSVWLFAFAGRPDLTQKYSRMILQSHYGVQGNGLPGNDDYATMSAWLIFASLGFYPQPSTQTYILGSPVIHSARIYRKMEDGTLKPFNIRVQKNRPSQYRVESVNLNQKVVKGFINHSEIDASNTLLTFAMKL